MTAAAGAGRPLDGLMGEELPASRARTARDALALLQPRLMAYGITRLARITRLDAVGIPVWSAIRPNARTLAVSQGKAEDDDGARIGAAMEALELAVAEAIARPLRASSIEAIEASGDAVLELPSLLRP